MTATAVVITGPPGAGNSAVATALHDGLGDEGVANALVECDELERSYPPLGTAGTLRHLRFLGDSYRAAGYPLLLVTATIEDAAYRDALLAALGGAARRLLVRLEAPPELLERRIRAREPAGWSGLEHLVESAHALAASMPALGGADLVLSTDGEAAEAVAARLRAELRDRGVA